MELQLWMLEKHDDKKIAQLTGIKECTIRDWRTMMDCKSEPMQGEVKREKITYPQRTNKKRKRYIDERNLQSAFVQSLNIPCKQYLHVPFGYIDVLTKDTIYELKQCLTRGELQQALGQITLYGTVYPNHKKVIVANVLKISFELEDAANKAGVEIIVF